MNKQVLESFVYIYRHAGKPPFDESGWLSFALVNRTAPFLTAIKNYAEKACPDDISISQRHNRIDIQNIGEQQGILDFKISKPSNRYYETINDFLKESNAIKGEIPDYYYIQECDYLCGDEKKTEIIYIEQMSSLVIFLKETLTHTVPEPTKLQFILLTHDKNNIAQKILLTTNCKKNNLVELEGFEDFRQRFEIDDSHKPERLSVFKQSLAELLASEPDESKRFPRILNNFSELKEIYNFNYESYIGKFSFNKLKAEIVAKSNELIKDINSILNNMASKTLVAPISLVALKFVNSESDKIQWFIFVGLVAISLVLSTVLYHQFSNLKHLKENISGVFSDLKSHQDCGKVKNCKVEELANKNQNRLQKKLVFLKRSFVFMGIIIWLPVFLFLFYKFNAEIVSFIVILKGVFVSTTNNIHNFVMDFMSKLTDKPNVIE